MKKRPTTGDLDCVEETKERYAHLWESCAAQSDALCMDACEVGERSARSTFLFFARYAEFNGFAGPLVARLASAIGLSRGVFFDGALSPDVGDREMEVAACVFAASIDEYADPRQKGRPHRTMAQATVEAAARFAGLDPGERNALAVLPEKYWLLLQRFLQNYQGAVNDPEKIVRSLGFHVGSEIRADREYAIIDGCFRARGREGGFGEWLRQHPTVDLDGERVSAWYWVVSHGRHEGAGVELEHFEQAIRGVARAREYSALPGSRFDALIQEGFADFVSVFDRLFALLREEGTA